MHYCICFFFFFFKRYLQCAVSYPDTPQLHLWSALCHSVRKDVECVFGSMKKRFRILKVPGLFKYKTDVDNIFFTSCWLHNLLHDASGAGAKFDFLYDV
jgi:hypothetical protein